MIRTSKELAERFGITMKAVRDVWNLRTWTSVTRPFWTPADHAFFVMKRRRPPLCGGSLPYPLPQRGLLTEPKVYENRFDAPSVGGGAILSSDGEPSTACNAVIKHNVGPCPPIRDELADFANLESRVNHGSNSPVLAYDLNREAVINSSSGRGNLLQRQALTHYLSRLLTKSTSSEAEQQDIWELVTEGLHIEAQQLHQIEDGSTPGNLSSPVSVDILLL